MTQRGPAKPVKIVDPQAALQAPVNQPIRSKPESVLRRNTLYAIRLVSDAANNAGFIKGIWYEHETV